MPLNMNQDWGMAARDGQMVSLHQPFGAPIILRGVTAEPREDVSGPEFTDAATNAIFEGEWFRPRDGYGLIGAALSATPVGMVSVFAANSTTVQKTAVCFTASTCAFYNWNTGSWVETAAGATTSAGHLQPPSAAYMHGKGLLVAYPATSVLIATNMHDGLAFADSTNAPRTGIIRASHGYAIAFGVYTTDPSGSGIDQYNEPSTRIQWCSRGDPSDWSNNQYFEFMDDGGGILGAELLPDLTYTVLRQNAISIFGYVGGRDEWAYQTPVRDIGGSSYRAQAMTPYGLFFISSDFRLYRYGGGAEVEEFGKEIIQQIRDQHNSTYFMRITLAYDPDDDALYIHVPCATSGDALGIPDRWWRFGFRYGSWSRGAWNHAAYAFGPEIFAGGIGDVPLRGAAFAAATSHEVYRCDDGYTDDHGDDFTMTVQTGWFIVPYTEPAWKALDVECRGGTITAYVTKDGTSFTGTQNIVPSSATFFDRKTFTYYDTSERARFKFVQTVDANRACKVRMIIPWLTESGNR